MSRHFIDFADAKSQRGGTDWCKVRISFALKKTVVVINKITTCTYR